MDSKSSFSDAKDDKDSEKSEKSKSEKKDTLPTDIFNKKAPESKSSELGDLFGESKKADSADTSIDKPSLLSGIVEREETFDEPEDTVEDIVEPTESSTIEHTQDSIETEAQDEVLSDDESQYAVNAIVDGRQEEVEAELSEAQKGSPEEIEAAASAALLDAVQEHIEAGEPAEQAIESAAEETLAEIEDMANEASAEVTGETEPPQEAIDEDTEDEPDDPLATANAAAQLQPQPPRPIIRPMVVPPPPPPGGPNNPTPPSSQTYHVPHFGAAPNPNAAPNTQTTTERRKHRAGDMLVGGVVGYLIGRRRGRIKTEARLLPIQEKLERQVTDLQKAIDEKETEVRSSAREKLVPKVASVEKNHQTATELAPEHVAAAVKLPGIEMIEPATETRQETSQDVLPEVQKPERILTQEKMVDWKIASFAEVLTMAATIEVHVKHQRRNIRELFERGSISKEEVRRLVVEYARGGSREALQPRLKEIEANELAPEFDKPREFGDSGSSQSGGSSSNDQASVSALPYPQPVDDALPITNDLQANPLPISQNDQQKNQPKDNHAQAAIGIGVGIGLLIALSLFLLLK